ncbi:iron complex transport system substrate-binding protein [Tranquillimonas rosea]|uniref:Iron complex transport system substrate-binding protein n=1 Tax=Tranquillimonas rosea TaxID=641238 RepID=A0A1H9WWC2_9RHOB|nr:iron-siderophore ABC transporter substrate-binding protein [Tranquillimonas rosea]SES38228.1 iron complex transport system substrate-binding protein [Tranquillimonas rosea]
MVLRLFCVLMCLAGSAQAFELPHDRGTVSLDAPPERIVALGWGLAELLVELDVAPAGVADPEGYATWVVEPELAADTVNVGLRNEPNLERIAELDPDLILAADQQTGLVPQLDRIAPTAYFKMFSADHDNAAKSREVYLALAGAFGVSGMAEQRLDALDARISKAGDRVRAAFDGPVPPVLPIRLLTPTSVRLHGENAMAVAALRGMGLTAADPGAPTQWGFRQARVEDLAAFEDAAVVHFDPFPQKDALFGSDIWQFMPFVRAGRFAVADPAWTFGGAFSLGRLADTMAAALTRIAEAE